MYFKHAIRIVDAETGEKKLFAIVNTGDVSEFRQLAKESPQYGSSDWLSVTYWNEEFADIDYTL